MVVPSEGTEDQFERELGVGAVLVGEQVGVHFEEGWDDGVVGLEVGVQGVGEVYRGRDRHAGFYGLEVVLEEPTVAGLVFDEVE